MPAKATAGSTPDSQRGQPVEQEVDLELRAGRLGVRVLAPRRAGSAAPRGRRWRARAAARHRVRARSPSCQVTSAPSVAGRRCELTPGAGDDLGPGVDGGPRERVGDRAHPADRHPPLAGAVADQVVEEAAVLEQRGVVHRGERADQRVGARPRRAPCRRRSAPRSPAPSGLVDHVAPDARVDQVADLALGGERLRAASGPRPAARSADVGVERRARRRTPSSPPVSSRERRRRRRALGPLDQQAAGAPVARSGRVRRRGARREPDVEVEVGHQLLRHQADRGRSSARAGRAARRTGSTDTAAPPVWCEPLEDEHREPGAGEVGGGARGRCGRRRRPPRHSCSWPRSPAQRKPSTRSSRARHRRHRRNVSFGTTTARPSTRPCARSSYAARASSSG